MYSISRGGYRRGCSPSHAEREADNLCVKKWAKTSDLDGSIREKLSIFSIWMVAILKPCSREEALIWHLHVQVLYKSTTYMHLLTIFLLLSIPWRLLQCSYYQWCSTRNNFYLSLSILYSKFHCDLQSFPILRCFSNIISNFFGRLKWATKDIYLMIMHISKTSLPNSQVSCLSTFHKKSNNLIM